MPLIPADLIATIKRDRSCAEVLEAAGHRLEKRGKDLVCRCPWHDDDTPSLVVSPAKNLWHCLGACQVGGDVINLVMKLRDCSFREAVEELHGQSLPSAAKPSCPLDPSGDDAALAGQVIDYYHSRLTTDSAAWDYLAGRGLARRDVIDHFRLGVADRSLSRLIPSKQVKAGKALRERLESLGYFRAETGHEHFNGSIVVPVLDERGNVAEAYGRKITRNLRKGTPNHSNLPHPHCGVWNLPGLRQGDGVVVLCEALIDALSCWANGIPNVTASYGTSGFTPGHLTAFQAAKIHTVIIAYDADAAGDAGAERVANDLIAEGFTVRRANLPQGQDLNDVAVTAGDDAPAVLAQIMESAVFWGGAPLETSAPEAVSEAAEPVTSSLAAPAAPTAATPEGLVETEGGDLELACGPRRWRVRGAPERPGSACRVSLRVVMGDLGHVDSVDLLQARARVGFIKAASSELGVKPVVLKQELGRVLRAVEAWQDDHRSTEAREAQATADAQAPMMSEADRDEALAFLRDPNLIGRVLADLDAAGLVGETANKLAVYLAATSRLLRRPLGILVQSSSSAGKSTVVDRVLDLMPEQRTHRYASLSENALVYEQRDIRHHILAIAELEGAEDAIYALKLLQSDGKLSRATVAKQNDTGNVAARELSVQGPVALFLTTTDRDVDPELQNRCLTLTICEDATQTQAIHDQQRLARTAEGLRAQLLREQIQQRHRNAQSLLRPLVVLNPYAPLLTFRTDRVRMRRDHEKYLALIDAVALLRQYQRETVSIDVGGAPVECINVTLEDIQVANELMHHLLGRSLDELPPQTRSLLGLIAGWVRDRQRDESWETPQFSRRDLVRFTGWTYRQVQIHLDRLVDHDYVAQHGAGRGGRLLYELVDDGSADDAALRCPGLVSVATLAEATGEPVPMTEVLPVDRPGLTPRLPGVYHPEMSNLSPDENGDLEGNGESFTGISGKAPTPKPENVVPYLENDAVDGDAANPANQAEAGHACPA